MNEVVYCTKCKNELNTRNTLCHICGKINTNHNTNNNNVEIIEKEINNTLEILTILR